VTALTEPQRFFEVDARSIKAHLSDGDASKDSLSGVCFAIRSQAEQSFKRTFCRFKCLLIAPNALQSLATNTEKCAASRSLCAAR
jgi:hypothetical protein